MKIEKGKRYEDGHGNIITIGGPTNDFPDWFWSIQGDWYDEEGRMILWRRKDHDYSSLEPYTFPTYGRNLVKEVA